MKQLRKHLNVANIISCIALFVALSGAAYAAKATLGNKAVKTRNLANGSVSTLKLRSGAVTTLKLRNGAVTGIKIAPGAVGSTQLANGAVRSSALGGGVVTENKIKNGAVSQAKLSTSFNAQLLKNMQYVVKISVSNSEPKSETAQCPSGKEVIGGGARLLGANTQLALTESSPVVNGGGKWSAAAVEINPEAGDWSIEVIAVCAEI